MLKRVYQNSRMLSLPQYELFVRFMKKNGMKEYLYNRNLVEPHDGLLKSYIETVISLAKEFIYDIDDSYITDENIHEKLSLCEFYRLVDSAGVSFTSELMRELTITTRGFATYIAHILINVPDLDMVIHEINETNIIVEIDKDSF